MKYIFFTLFLFFCSANFFSQSVGGVLNSNTVVCQGANNGTLSVNNYTGNILRWEYATAPGGPWVPLAFTSPSYNYVNIMQSSYFRVIVKLTGYSEAISNVVSVICDEPSVSGSVSSNTLQCINSPITLNLNGNTGNVLSWEYSTTNWIITNTLSTTNTLSVILPVLTTTTQIRARVQNGVCPSVLSNTLIVNSASPSDGGSISGTQSVCANSNSALLTLNNYTGSILQWESSLSSGGPFNVISSSANTHTLTYTNLTQNTWYRTLVKNSNCPDAYSSIFQIHVDAPSTGGSIAGTQNVCSAFNSGTLQLLAYAGNINQWEYSANNGILWNVINNTGFAQTFTNIASTRIYRALVQNGLCSSVFSNQFTVNVNPIPTPAFNLNDACVLTPASFTNLTTGVNSYVWDFGDAGSASIFSPNHIYSTSGSYSVKLTVTSALGCTDSIKKPILIHPNPMVSFISADTACYGNTISFHNSSTISSGNIVSLKFNFDDGTNSTLASVQHFFQSEGTYSVSLTAISNQGCQEAFSKQIIIYPKPLSNFAAKNVCKGNAVIFNNLSILSSGSLQHQWNFGNTNLSVLSSPSHNYPDAGTFTVSLMSSSNHNCKDTVYKTITVNETPAITFSAINACLGNAVNFSSTFNPASSGLSVTVNFGDGSFANTSNPSHTYLSSGTFASNIIAVTDSGCVSEANRNVTVYSKPFANFNFNNVCNADSVLFNNTSSISSGSMHYFWDLSGLSTSTLNSPQYLYAAPGNYTISLIAATEFNCSDTIVKPLTIFDAPKVGFIFSNACSGFPVTFTNTSTVNSGIISKTYWDFGDNSTANVLNPTRDYLNNGSYVVTLIGESSNGCTDTIKQTVYVYEGPVAKFSAQDECLNTAITFTNLSLLSSGTFSSTWRFNDGNFSDKNSPSHVYAHPGVHQVWLKTISSDFCLDSVSRLVEVFAAPKIIAGKDTTIDKGFGINLAAIGANYFNWSPTSGLNNPTLKSPFANPETTTEYIVEGIDQHGCKNTDTVVVTIRNDFLVIPYNILTPDGNEMNDTWIVKNINAYPENKVIIFDQWNQKVYEKEGYNNEWEGKNKTGEILPDATYYYILTFSKSNKKYSGYITLIRNK